MPRIKPLDRTHAPADVAATLDAVDRKIGKVPNLVATLAHSPQALNAYLQLSETLAGGQLSAAQRETVALAVAQSNECQYCLSAHTALGKAAGLGADDIARARAGTASDPLDAAIAGFARTIAANRGVVSDTELDALRRAGGNDGLVLEIVANVVLNVLTNYTNHIAGTDIDFPVVDTTPSTAAA